MSEAIMLEFRGVTSEQYNAVNAILGIDPATGSGDWPPGLLSHTGANGGEQLVVFEVWESQQAQQDFMSSRLGPALGQVGLPEPTRIQWLSVLGHMSR